MPAYDDRLGGSYAATRAPDPRIEAAIHAALGDASSVVNVGAGTGAYEPDDREVVAVEPSAVMRAQRPPGAAPCLDASAEALPLDDDSADAAMAILTVHHWRDLERGLAELRRVARRRAVVLTWDATQVARLWLARDYLADICEADAAGFPTLERTIAGLGGATVTPIPIPADCRDGFLGAYWKRPRAYLDPMARANISTFARRPDSEVAEGLARLAADLESGVWERRNAGLFDLDEVDLGYRLLVSEL